MRVVTPKTINAYCDCYPEAAVALRSWVSLIKGNHFKHFKQLREVFGTADLIKGDIVVFNIKGNQFRLIAAIDFKRQAAFVKWFGRHKDYNKINPSEVKHEYPPC